MPHDAATRDEPPAIGLDEIDVREIALELRRDVRTIRRVLRGEEVRGIAGAEINRAIAARMSARGAPAG